MHTVTEVSVIDRSASCPLDESSRVDRIVTSRQPYLRLKKFTSLQISRTDIRRGGLSSGVQNPPDPSSCILGMCCFHIIFLFLIIRSYPMKRSWSFFKGSSKIPFLFRLEMVIVYLILITPSIASSCHFLLIVLEFGVLLPIPNTLVKLIG